MSEPLRFYLAFNQGLEVMHADGGSARNPSGLKVTHRGQCLIQSDQLIYGNDASIVSIVSGAAQECPRVIIDIVLYQENGKPSVDHADRRKRCCLRL